MILPKTPAVPDIVTSGLASVAIRMPRHPVFRRLLREVNRPLAAPSANPFGYISPTTSQHVKDHLDGRIATILDGGPCQVGVESTIIDLRQPRKPVILRPGGISKSQIESSLGIRVIQRSPGRAPKGTIEAPGQLDRHYSPKTPLLLYRSLPQNLPHDEAIVFYKPSSGIDGDKTNKFSLTSDGLGSTAAHNLFALLQKLDRGQWKRIHMELPPVQDPWHPALLDRMRRASTR